MNGQAKIDFEKWLMNGNDGVSNFGRTIELTRLHFLALKETCQQSLIIEWFDSVWIYVNAVSFEKQKYWKAISDGIMLNKKHSSRQQATEKAIEKAIILYNEKFKQNE